MVEKRDNIKAGFTLIELSIVLVIIGLIVGGVLVGRDLIVSATVRAQITQIEKYNQAVNTFYGKYGGLPGDLAANLATQFNLTSRAGTGGEGDGNGELDGFAGTSIYEWNENGELWLFWEDLSSANLVDGSFKSYVDGTSPGCSTPTNCTLYMPQAKIGNGNFVYVYSGLYNCCGNYGSGANFYGISIIKMVGAGSSNVGSCCSGSSAVGLTVSQAYAMDSKVDDGLPDKGRVIAQLLDPVNGGPIMSTSAASAGSSTCFDTSKGYAAYSISYAGSALNCGISFRIQSGGN